MFAYCDECGYDTGDFDTRKEIYDKLEEDGGVGYHEYRDHKGRKIKVYPECPNGHQEIRID